MNEPNVCGGLCFACALQFVQQVMGPPRETEHAKDLGASLAQRLTENSDTNDRFQNQ